MSWSAITPPAALLVDNLLKTLEEALDCGALAYDIPIKARGLPPRVRE